MLGFNVLESILLLIFSFLKMYWSPELLKQGEGQGKGREEGDFPTPDSIVPDFWILVIGS